MNTTAIANHLNVAESAIVRIERWTRCLFVVIKGIGARFVSYKVVDETIKKMLKIGGERWQGYGKDRVYFHGSVIARILELSNSKARQINSGKFYYDVQSQTFHSEQHAITYGVHDRSIGGNIYWVTAIEELVGI